MTSFYTLTHFPASLQQLWQTETVDHGVAPKTWQVQHSVQFILIVIVIALRRMLNVNLLAFLAFSSESSMMLESITLPFNLWSNEGVSYRTYLMFLPSVTGLSVMFGWNTEMQKMSVHKLFWVPRNSRPAQYPSVLTVFWSNSLILC